MFCKHPISFPVNPYRFLLVSQIVLEFTQNWLRPILLALDKAYTSMALFSFNRRIHGVWSLQTIRIMRELLECSRTIVRVYSSKWRSAVAQKKQAISLQLKRTMKCHKILVGCRSLLYIYNGSDNQREFAFLLEAEYSSTAWMALVSINAPLNMPLPLVEFRYI